MNLDLRENPTIEDVKDAIMQKAPLTSPGLDGFNVGFYYLYWHVLREEVTMAV